MQESTEIFLRKNFFFSLLMGGSFCLVAFIFYKSGHPAAFESTGNNILLLLSVSGMYIGGKTFRDEANKGIISYGKALAVMFFIIGCASIIYGIFIFSLYSSDPEFFNLYKESLEVIVRERLSGEYRELADFIKEATTPAVIAFSSVFRMLFLGFIFALPTAQFIKKKPINRHSSK